MIKKRIVIVLFLVSCSISAQIKGVIKDSISGKPISYVNIWIQNENIGTTSEEDGTFRLHAAEKNKNLIFSALGFEKKVVKAFDGMIVSLKPTTYQLDEVVIGDKRAETKEIEIGQTENSLYQAFDNGPRIDTKFFPYSTAYKKTKYIKKVSVQTDCRLPDAIVKIHFYSVDANGYPGEELLDKDFIVTVKKGVRKTYFNVTNLNLRMPKSGIFVAFERLSIERNRATGSYAPFVLYSLIEKEHLFTFTGGKWIKKSKQNPVDGSDKMMIHEPAINLILTN